MPVCRAAFNEFAPPRDTFDLGQFWRDNPAGIIVSAALLAIVCLTGLRSAKAEHKTRSAHGRVVAHMELSRSAYVKQQKSLRAAGWPVCASMLVHLRTRWTCGSLLYPIEGDPMDASQRLFTITTTVITTCAVNIVFHQLNDNAKEICETSEGPGVGCTDELDSRGLCICAVYACDSPGCNNCVACDTITSCHASCTEVQPSTWRPVILSSCIVTPVVFCLNWAFKWWHKPLVDAVSNIVALPATLANSARLFSARQHADRFSPQQTTDRQDESINEAVAERRTALAALLPYGVSLICSIGSIFIIASISRAMSSRMTWAWILSVIYSLALKWAIIDPVKVTVLTPVFSWAQRHHWSQRLVKFLYAVCLGTTKPHHFRDHVQRVIVLQRNLKSARRQLMRERIAAVRERDTAALDRAHEERVSTATSDGVRKRLKAKHQQQRQEMLVRLAAIDQQLEAVVEGERNAYDCVANVAGTRPPNALAARRLMQDFEEACQQAMNTLRHDQQAATEVRVYTLWFLVLCKALTTSERCSLFAYWNIRIYALCSD
eukprot:COSAG02_NODE_1307_length_13340_cov_84.665282_12_plen_548_part_00